MVTGDFNRHDTLWGGDAVSQDRLGEGELILNFIMKNQLFSALPQGTTTYSSKSGEHQTTIDLMLAPIQLQQSIQECRINSTDHGSDHQAIKLVVDVGRMEKAKPRIYQSLDTVDWEKTRQAVKAALKDPPQIQDEADLNAAAIKLEETV